ncbi:MAG: hypothetical protein LBI28_11310 [Treponema sp.]|nr:hypothetical protein [Treponema sp.]
MKKINIVLSFVLLILVYLIGCTSNPQTTPTTILPTRQESFFDGFWIMPNGLTMYIHYDVYIVSTNQTVINYGIFTYSDTRIRLNWDRNAYTEFDYQKDEENFIVTNAYDNEFVLGMWHRDTNIDFEYNSRNKIEGYWENRDGNKIRIFQIMPNGMGFQLTCNSDLFLEVRAIVTYEGISPSEISITIDTEGMFPVKMPLGIIYERNAIKIGVGNISTFLRYERQ